MAKSTPPQTEITVLSVKQPWADWLLAGQLPPGPKWCENRSWMTKYRGTLYIHATTFQKPPDDAQQALLWKGAPYGGLVGAILGSVELVECADANDVEECYHVLAGQSRRKLTDRQRSLLEYLPNCEDAARFNRAWEWWSGQNAWIVRDPKPLAAPIKVSGKLRLWTLSVPPAALKPMKKALRPPHVDFCHISPFTL